MKAKVEAIDALLPQTQCGECGFQGCKPYAEALALGAAPISLCPPGGLPVLKGLAQLLGQDPSPFIVEVASKARPAQTAYIVEEECIGCTKCISACPVDAIVGSAKLLHNILVDECTGCGLCLEPCPVDCIELLPLEAPLYDKDLARHRYEAAKLRALQERIEKEASYQAKRRLTSGTLQASDNAAEDKQAKQAFIMQAMARVQNKKP